MWVAAVATTSPLHIIACHRPITSSQGIYWFQAKLGPGNFSSCLIPPAHITCQTTLGHETIWP